MDLKVKEIQQWLNDSYPRYFYYNEDESLCGSYPIKPDGQTGSKTVKALIMAFQIHKNLLVDGVWGNETMVVCPTINHLTRDRVLIRIAQAGFYCKGYEPGGFDGYYGNNMAAAIVDFKNDLGINTSSNLEKDVFKSLLTTDPTVLVSIGDENIRKVQRYLNGVYSRIFMNKLGYIPTGGVFERKTSKALIYAFQHEIGTVADGGIGPMTFNQMPSIQSGCTNSGQVKILQALLICNGFDVGELDGGYGNFTKDMVEEFQMFMCLNNDNEVELGKVNRRTWAALLISCGDKERTPNACDCRQQLDLEKAQSLYNDGYRFIGRYITKVEGGYDKNLTSEEIQNIFSAGLKIFPIFQESNNKLEYFSYDVGYLDGCKAIHSAIKLRIPARTTIYFCVDYDAFEENVKKEISAYFKGINNAISDMGEMYEVGIYSSRNTCKIICDKELANSSFVSNMSTGYSGNLGYTMPENWAYDQYKTGKYCLEDGTSFDLDCNMASTNAKYFDSITEIGDVHWDEHKFNIGLEALEKYSNDAFRILEVIDYIKLLENKYKEFDQEGTEYECILAILYLLWEDKYSGLFEVTLKKNVEFVDFIMNTYPEIYNNLESVILGEYNYVKDDLVFCESLNKNIDKVYTYNSFFELPHLAIVIQAYIENDLSSLKKEWFGWAGDLVTGIHEVDEVAKVHTEATIIQHARDRIGKMEILENNKYNFVSTGSVQINYCDIIADLDAVGISKIIKQKLKEDKHINILSYALELYYTKFNDKRALFFLNELSFSDYTVKEMEEKIYLYIMNPGQDFLKVWKQAAFVDASYVCKSFAEILVNKIM